MNNGMIWDLPSGYVKIAIENGHRNSVFSHEKWVDLSIAMLNYQRVRGFPCNGGTSHNRNSS